MLYAIVAEDVPNSQKLRRAARSAHLLRLQHLQDEGRLVLAGPMLAMDAPVPGPSGCAGSLIVAEFPSLEEAEAWLAAEPFVTEGVFARTWVHPFLQTFPQ